MGVEDCVTTELFFMIPFGAFVLICFYLIGLHAFSGRNNGKKFTMEQWQKIYYGTMIICAILITTKLLIWGF